MNLTLFLWLHHIGNSSLFVETLVVWFARYAQYVIILIVFVFLMVEFYHHKRVIQEALIITSTAVAAWSVSAIIKFIVQAPRPFLAIETVNPLFMYGGHNSFPSGHATIFFALAMAVYFYSKPLSVVLFIAAFCIAISRVMAGIHFPIDIFVGALLGLGIAYVIHRYEPPFFKTNPRKRSK